MTQWKVWALTAVLISCGLWFAFSKVNFSLLPVSIIIITLVIVSMLGWVLYAQRGQKSGANQTPPTVRPRAAVRVGLAIILVGAIGYIGLTVPHETIVSLVPHSWLPWGGGVIGALVLWYLVGRRALGWWLVLNILALLVGIISRGPDHFEDFVLRGFDQLDEFYTVFAVQGFSEGLQKYPNEATWLVGSAAFSLILLIVLSMVLRSVPSGMTPGNFIGRIMELVGHAAAGTVTNLYRLAIIIPVALLLTAVAAANYSTVGKVVDSWFDYFFVSGELEKVNLREPGRRVFGITSQKDWFRVTVPGRFRSSEHACPKLLALDEETGDNVLVLRTPDTLFTRDPLNNMGDPVQIIRIAAGAGQDFVAGLLEEGVTLAVQFEAVPQPGYCHGTREEQ